MDATVEILNGLVIPSQLGLRFAAAEVSCGVVGIEPDRPVVVFNGFVVAAQPGTGVTPLEIELGRVGIEADRLGAIDDCFLVPLSIGGFVAAEVGELAAPKPGVGSQGGFDPCRDRG